MPPVGTNNPSGGGGTSNKRKSSNEDDATGESRPKKMTKAEKAASKERARQAMQQQQQQRADDGGATTSKRKKVPTPAAVSAPVPIAPAPVFASTPSPESKKAALARARERARLAMVAPVAAAAAPTTTTTVADTETAKPAAKKPRRTNRSTTATAKKPAAKVTIAESGKKAAAAAVKQDADEMALPPTALRRTQSTPLELEIEQQVIANGKAAMEGKPLPFTSAPPEHLLKFAPTELEEGYDHDDDNVVDVDEDVDADEEDTWNAVTSAVLSSPATPLWKTILSALGGIKHTLILVVVGALGLAVLLRSPNHGIGFHVHKSFHLVMARLPFIRGNPYRTPNGAKPLPYMPCYETNVMFDDHQTQPPYRAECTDPDIMTETCPTLGECWGGDLQQCILTEYLHVAPSQRVCQMTPAVQAVFDLVQQQVATWTLDHHCQQDLGDFYHDTVAGTTLHQESDSPPPYLMATKPRDRTDNHQMATTTTNRKQPMFLLERILEINLTEQSPALASAHPHDTWSVESLFRLIEAGNKVSGYPFFTKILSHEVVVPPEHHGEDQEHVEPRTVMKRTFLIAVDPAKQYVNKLFPRRTQCRYRMFMALYHRWMKTPWLFTVWIGTTVGLLVWMFLTHHSLRIAAERQRQFLQRVETTRGAVLTLLKTTSPRAWRSWEILAQLTEENKSKNLSDTGNEDSGSSTTRDTLFEERIWPRVVFDIRGHPNVETSVVVSNSDLIDVWQWRTVNETSSSAAAAGATTVA